MPKSRDKQCKELKIYSGLWFQGFWSRVTWDYDVRSVIGKISWLGASKVKGLLKPWQNGNRERGARVPIVPPGYSPNHHLPLHTLHLLRFLHPPGRIDMKDKSLEHSILELQQPLLHFKLESTPNLTHAQHFTTSDIHVVLQFYFTRSILLWWGSSWAYNSRSRSTSPWMWRDPLPIMIQKMKVEVLKLPMYWTG